MHSNYEHHIILCILMENLGAYIRSLDIVYNLIFSLKIHSNCESMDIQSPTELREKNIIMEIIIMEKKRFVIFLL